VWDARDVLKWRAEGVTRRVAASPELLAAIDSHIERFGTADDGRIFTTGTGSPIAGILSETWRGAVSSMWPAGHPFHNLRPYDLRHVHATALLVEGISPMRVAERLGHSVEVLFRTYAGVFAETDDAERLRIANALGE
jgi:integrase